MTMRIMGRNLVRLAVAGAVVAGGSAAAAGAASAATTPTNPWDDIAQCESGGNWSMNSGNGYYGGLQFSLASWRDVGGSGYPHEHSKSEQIHRGKILQARYGWDQWPVCARELGYM